MRYELADYECSAIKPMLPLPGQTATWRQLLSWLAPADGVLNVSVFRVGSIAAEQRVARTRGRPINRPDWSPGGRHPMFLNGENEDANLHQ